MSLTIIHPEPEMITIRGWRAWGQEGPRDFFRDVIVRFKNELEDGYTGLYIFRHCFVNSEWSCSDLKSNRVPDDAIWMYVPRDPGYVEGGDQ